MIVLLFPQSNSVPELELALTGVATGLIVLTERYASLSKGTDKKITQ